jgi:hypothetical protein
MMAHVSFLAVGYVLLGVSITVTAPRVVRCQFRSPSETSLDGRALHLSEIRHAVIPATFTVIGGIGSADNRFLVWSANKSYLMVSTSTGWVDLPVHGSNGIIGASFVGSDTVIEILSSNPPEIVRISSGGTQLDRHRLGIWADSLTLETAAMLDSGWFIGGLTQDRSYRIAWVDRAGSEQVLSKLPFTAGRQASFRMVGRKDHVIISSRLAPYDLTVLYPNGVSTTVSRKSDLLSKGLSALNDSTAFWVALTPVSLNDGFLQTFADLRSDRRILVRYDSEFRLAAHVVADVPLAFMTSIPNKRLLLVARNTGDLELVTYEWSWTPQ